MVFLPHWKLRWDKSSVCRHTKTLAAAALSIGLATAWAQYPGHSAGQVKAGPVLRSVAVLEWVGQPGKPSASRLIPVVVYHDGEYQDGGLYLARPEPLSLNDGTEYQLQDSGTPQGVFDVYTALHLAGDWFGYGAWKPLPTPPPVHPLKEGTVEVVDPGSDRRPHFRKAPPADSSTGPAGATPPEDPERPTLRKRPEQAPDKSGTANPGTTAATGTAETATPGGDPDRPHLTRNAPTSTKNEAPHLDGMPPALQQTIAVSDASDRREHSLRYKWASPDDATKMQAALTTIALQAVAKATQPKAPPKSAPIHTTPHPAAHPTTHTATTTRTPAATHRPVNTTHRKAIAPAQTLTDVKFDAFELTYSGGATLVLTGRTAASDESNSTYVTVIAQPDIYGTPQVLFTQVAQANDLDATPRMRLVDAVDVAADNRGDLIFELRGNTTRQFAVYRVASGKVAQLVATVPISTGKVVEE